MKGFPIKSYYIHITFKFRWFTTTEQTFILYPAKPRICSKTKCINRNCHSHLLRPARIFRCNFPQFRNHCILRHRNPALLINHGINYTWKRHAHFVKSLGITGQDCILTRRISRCWTFFPSTLVVHLTFWDFFAIASTRKQAQSSSSNI